METVVCFGTFDGLDAGHEILLTHAASQAPRLCVLVEPDVSVLERHGQLPASGEFERLTIVRSHPVVDDVRIVHPNQVLEVSISLNAAVIVIPFFDIRLRAKLEEEAQSLGLTLDVMSGPPTDAPDLAEAELRDYPMDALPI